MFRSLRGVSGWLAVWLVVSAASRAGAEDVYFYRPVSGLTLTEGHLPKDQDPNRTGSSANGRLRSIIQPYGVIEGEGEVYIDKPADARGGAVWAVYPNVLAGNDLVAFRVPGGREVSGRLFAPRGDNTGMELLAFKAVPPPPQDDAKEVFARARGRHYERLALRNLPGAAWFRYQAIGVNAQGRPAGRAANVARVNATPLEQSFSLFGGGRAIDENLQLDRPMTPAGVPTQQPRVPERVKTEGLRGISVAEMDWAARLKDRTPALDPLAASIPADQHALFLPDLKAAGALAAEFHGDSIPVLGLIAPHSEDRGVMRRYEAQLGVSLADLGRFPGAGAIKGLAVTGSDPYLPSGTDLAFLIETGSPDDLRAFLTSKRDGARRARPDAVVDRGEIDGVHYAGARTPDRALSSYVAVLGQVVVVTNSVAQLGRLVETAHGKTPKLAEQADYRFFRDRYPRGDGSESAFLVLTDATIRRWCGPRWRIGSSRRVRAGSALAEIQAVHLPAIVGESKTDDTPRAPGGSIDLGALHLSRAGVRSEVYGTLDFQTPIVELPLDEVGRDEADAYGRWRDGYQQNWRGVFDPIAVRLSVRPDRLAADVTVMPLIASSEYRPFIEVVGAARLAPDAGDRHPGSLVHAVLALDLQSKLLRQGNDLIANVTHIPQQVALGWLGSSAALYLDDDPEFWAGLGAAENPQTYALGHVDRVPVGIQVAVTNGAKLALFLAGLRAFVDQSAPNLTHWENREHRGQRYVCVSEAEGARPAASGPRFALYYYSSPRSLTVSLNEDLIKRAIDRQEAKGKAEPGPGPWLGESLALRVSRRGFETLGGAGRTEYRDELQVRSWGNLPILTEWKRLYPERDPVALHQAVWGSTLVDPGGGRYVWNARWATMESTVFGHPGEPKTGHETENPLSRFGSAGLGLSFEDGGLRARTEVELVPKP